MIKIKFESSLLSITRLCVQTYLNIVSFFSLSRKRIAIISANRPSSLSLAIVITFHLSNKREKKKREERKPEW
jgi:hypothetical protein